MSKRKRGGRTVKGWYGIFFYSHAAGIITGMSLMRYWPDLFHTFFMIFVIGMTLHYLWYLFSDEPEGEAAAKKSWKERDG